MPHNNNTSKTRKVFSVVGRPVRGVGRRLRFKKSRAADHNDNYHPGNADFDAERDDDDDGEDDFSSSSDGGGTDSNSIGRDVIGMRSRPKQRHASQGQRRRRLGILSAPFHSLGRRSQSSDSNETNSYASVVGRLEGGLRYLSVIFAAYIFGTYSKQHYLWPAGKMLEYTLVAWVTCVIILLVGDYHHFSVDTNAEEQRSDKTHDDRLQTRSSSVSHHASREFATTDLDAHTDDANGNHLSSLHKSIMPHPALEPFFVIDCGKLLRIIPNSETPYQLETEYFTGEMMLLIRTPDCDDPTAISTPETLAASDYLRDKQRRFEFQFQIRLKKIPTGRVYFSCELGEQVKLGIIQRAFVGAAMAFVRTTNNNFHYSLQGSVDSTNGGGREEKPHMAFPVEEGMNRVVATPHGETPPKLGSEIVEDPEHFKRRRKGAQIEWALDCTYTLSLWSAYVDFLQWRCLNLPGIRPFQLSNVIGQQPITLTLYEIPDDRPSDKHYKEDVKQIVEIEMCNPCESGLGTAASQWMQMHGAKLAEGHGSEGNLPTLTPSRSVDDQPAEEPTAEDEDVAELGEGIYVRSGDAVHLREILGLAVNQEVGPTDDSTAFVTHGADYAVVQEGDPAIPAASITIERVTKGRSSKLAGSPQLIKSGDTVLFKLSIKGRRSDGSGRSGGSETRYLSVHKGWWLKWVGSAPTKSAQFVVHSCDAADDKDVETPSDAQSSLLTFGGSFRISSKRWPKYQVGVAPEGSATYGGRMLGLYYPRNGFNTIPDEDELDDDFAFDDSAAGGYGERSKRHGWLRPLLLRPLESVTQSPATAQASAHFRMDQSTDDMTWLSFSSEDFRMDVPAWVEMMNRSDRVRQLLYVVRVSRQDCEQNQDDEAIKQEPFMRLRSGRELSQIIRVGMTWRNRTSSRRLGVDDVGSFKEGPITFNESYNEREESESAQLFMSEEESDSSVEWIADSDEEFERDADQGAHQAGKNRVKRTAQLVGKISKQTGKSVVAKGKSAMRQSVRVGKETVNAGVKATKGTVTAVSKSAASLTRVSVYASKKVGKTTVNAGKAIIAPTKPPSKEPRFNATKSGVDGELHLATKKGGRSTNETELHDVIAGELSGPEQSCRTVSNMLTSMSCLARESPFSSNFNALLSLQVHQRSDQESQFLTNGAVQIGAKPRPLKDLSYECLVARCLWESHWREELCQVSGGRLLFYAPLTGDACLELLFEDIKAVRSVDNNQLSPLPGYPLLVIETAWTCHYMACRSEEKRENLRLKILEAMQAFAMTPGAKATKELAQARFWQGFQDSVGPSSSGRGKWADVMSGTKGRQRFVLNNRRMAFDLASTEKDPTRLVEDLLASSLSFCLENLKQHPEELVEFLDLTCQLRKLSLAVMDFSAPATFCFFVNLYHCLLQHSLLLTLTGPLTKRSFGHFMRTSCYEVGKEVFSLAELHACVIRGNLSRPASVKFPVVEPPKKSDAYRCYALDLTTPQINFLLNTGDVSCMRTVPVLVAGRLESQINSNTVEFLQRNVRVDIAKRTVFLPRVCDIYRHDYTTETVGAGSLILRFLVPFLDDEIASTIAKLQSDRELPLTIKFSPALESFHSSLTKYLDESSSE